MGKIAKECDAAEKQRVWREYKASGDRRLRNRLIEWYRGLVIYHALRLKRKLPACVDVGDLEGEGIFGLIDAIEAYDPDRGVRFGSFAAQRIRGSMLDRLRLSDWAPRLARKRWERVEAVKAELEASLGRRPTQLELAQRLEMSPAQFAQFLEFAAAPAIGSLSWMLAESDAGRKVRLGDALENPRAEPPGVAASRRDWVRALLAGLTRAEKLIVILYHCENMTMKEIGAAIGLSESRVSQLHSLIIARLRDRAAAEMEDGRLECSIN